MQKKQRTTVEQGKFSYTSTLKPGFARQESGKRQERNNQLGSSGKGKSENKRFEENSWKLKGYICDFLPPC